MQGILISLASAITLAILGAFAAPLVVDWNAWRGTFEREIGRTLGIPVVIRGPIAAEILPAPHITLKDVTLGDVISTGGTVREFQAELSLGALMRGQVEATGVTLVNPRMRIVIDSNGRIAMPTGAGGGADIGIARLEVRDGSLDLLDRSSDHTVTLDDLDLRGEARSLAGPFRLDGEVEAGGARFGLRSTLSKLDGAGGGKLKLALDGRSRPYTVELDGTFTAPTGAPAFDGRASVTRKGAGSLDSWQLSGHLKASPAQVVADSLELALGGAATPAQLAGAARLTLGRAVGLDVVLNARSLDLDALGAGGPAPGATSPAIRPAEALARGLWQMADLPTPDIASRIGVSSEQVVLGGTVIRDMRLDMTGGPQGWRIDTAEAQLPGKAELKVSGAPDKGAFAGTLSFNAEDPAAFARWAAPDAARDVAAAVQGPVRLAGRARLAPNAVTVDNLNALMGQSRLTGSIAAALPAGANPKLDLNLTMDGFTLDPLVAALQRVAVAVGGGADASLKLEGQNLTIADQPLGRLSLDASATGGSWRVKRMVMDNLNGLQLEGAGWMENFSSTPRGEFNLSVNGAKADGLVPVARLVVGPEAGDVVARLAPVAAPLKLSTTVVWSEAGGRRITSSGNLGRMTGQVAFTRSAADVPLAIDLSVDAQDGAQALGALGLEGLNPRLGPVRGAFTLSPLVQGEGDVKLRLDAATVNLKADGKARWVNGALSPRLAVRADGSDLGRLLPQLAAAANNAPVPAALAFDLSRPEGAWHGENIEGSLAGLPITGNLDLEPGTVPRLTGRLAFDSLSVPAIAGLFGARASAPEGGAPWSSGRFTPNAVSGVAFGLDLVAARLNLIGPYTLTTAKMRLVSDGVDLDLRDINGSFGGGTASAHLEVRRRADAVEAEGRLQLDKVELPALAAPTGTTTPPMGRVSLSLDLGGSGHTPLQLVQSLTGQGTIGVRNLDVSDASPGALSAVLAETADSTPPPDERQTALLLDRALARGSLRIESAESTLSTVGGVVRLSPARVPLSEARVTLSGGLDLARLQMEAGIDLEGTAQAGASPSGTLAWRGPVTAPERRVTATGLTSVIAMRAIERETRRLEEQRANAPAAATPAAATSLTPASTPQMAPPLAPPTAPPTAPAPRIAPSVPPAASQPTATAPVTAPARPAVPATRPALPPAPRPVPHGLDGIERRDLPAPTPGTTTSFGTSTSAPAAGTTTSPTTSPAATPQPASRPAPSRPPQGAQTNPAPATSTAQQTTPRTTERPPATVVRPPLPLEPTLPPTRGFGDLPRPPGLVGE